MSAVLNSSLRVTIGVSLALVLLQGILSYVVIDNFRSAIRANVDKQQFALVTSLAHELDDKIQEHERLMSEIAKGSGPEVFTNSMSAREFLATHRDAAAVFDHGLFLFTGKGQLLAELPFRTAARLQGDLSRSGYLQKVIEQRKPIVSQPYVTSVNNEPVVMIAVPVLDRDGNLRGILGGALSLLHDNFLSNIAQARIGTSGYLYLFGTDRTMIVHPDKSRILKKDVAPNTNLMFDRAVAGFEGSGVTVNSKGLHTVTSFKRLQSASWILAANFPVKEAYAPLSKAIRNLVIALAVTIMGSCLALYLIAGRLKGEVDKRAEAEDQASLLLDSVEEGVLGVTAAGAVSFVNKAALALLGYDEATELIGRDVREVLHRTHAECPNCPREKCRVYPVFVSGTVQHSENEQLWRRDGSSFVADFFCTPVWNRGTLHGAVMTFRDVSERRATEERLRLQGAALEAAANSIIITDRTERITWVNQSFTRLTGYSREEAIGRLPHEFLTGSYDEGMFHSLWQAIRSKQSWHGELVTRRKDGSLYDEDVTITPVLDEQGEISHFIGIMQDISPRKHAEEAILQSKEALEKSNRQLVQAVERASELTVRAERANAFKSKFLANMSHEIRTPMHAIIGMSRLLQDTPLSTKQGEYLRIISCSAESLLGVINDILDFSKIEAGKLEIGRVSFSPADIIREVVTMTGPRAAEKRLGLHHEMDRSVPALLVGDPLRLSQILNNLLANAVKFTNEGEISLVTRVLSRSGEQVELEFSVRDTGVGISDDDQAYLFQAFEQVDGSITRNYGGTGLGLAICRQLTTLMGGRIWCSSTPGKGSTFTFCLPFIASGAEKSVTGQLPPLENTRFSGQRILLVEDNTINQLLAVNLLQRAGLDVTVAGNGLTAVEMVRQQEFHLVLMDVQMPVMDGLAATRQIRSLDKGGADTLPILAMSANAMEQDVRACLSAGMNGHLAKPFMPDEMYAAISHYLGAQPAKPAPVGCPDPAAGGSVELAAQIPGVDMDKGIRQLGGDQNLYRELLRRFFKEYGGGVAELQRAIDAGDRKGAAILVHSIKGIAGVLAAAPLQNAAQGLETALNNNGEDFKSLWETFVSELESMLSVLGSHSFPDATLDSSVSQEASGEWQMDDLAAALRECDPTRCSMILANLRQRQWPAEAIGHLTELGRLVNDYRYEEALVVLASLHRP